MRRERSRRKGNKLELIDFFNHKYYLHVFIYLFIYTSCSRQLILYFVSFPCRVSGVYIGHFALQYAQLVFT